MLSNDQFSLKTNSGEFTARLNSVFDGITGLEKDHEDWKRNQDSMQDARLWKAEPGEETPLETQFKRPRGFPMKRRLPTLDYVPNFKKNPSKWTKYSLANVPELSDRSNTRAALSFLEDRKRQKLETVGFDGSTPAHATSTQKIVFHKPQSPSVDIIMQSEDSVDTEKGEHASQCTTSVAGKFVMPECVVGAKKTRRNVSGSMKPKPCLVTTVHLDHLDEEESEQGLDMSKCASESENSGNVCYSGFRKSLKKMPECRKLKDDSDFNGPEDCEIDLE